MLNICEVFPIRKNLIRNIVQTPLTEPREALVKEFIPNKSSFSLMGFLVMDRVGVEMGKSVTQP